MPDKTKNKSGFFRFYGQTDEKIEECIEKLKELAGKGLVKVTRKKLKQSMNPFVPTDNNTEVLFHFDTPANVVAFFKRPQIMDIYLKYATASGNTPVVMRKPGDPAFAV